jgi:hypothetical protein
MSHQRTTIRAALVDLLTGTSPTYGTNAGSNVFSNRIRNIQHDNLPAIVVRDGAETLTPRDLTSRFFTRRWNVKIEILIEASSDYDEAVDDIALQIEDLIAANRTLTGTCQAAIYTGVDEPEYTAGEKPIGKVTLNYDVTYMT